MVPSPSVISVSGTLVSDPFGTDLLKVWLFVFKSSLSFHYLSSLFLSSLLSKKSLGCTYLIIGSEA